MSQDHWAQSVWAQVRLVSIFSFPVLFWNFTLTWPCLAFHFLPCVFPSCCFSVSLLSLPVSHPLVRFVSLCSPCCFCRPSSSAYVRVAPLAVCVLPSSPPSTCPPLCPPRRVSECLPAGMFWCLFPVWFALFFCVQLIVACFWFPWSLVFFVFSALLNEALFLFPYFLHPVCVCVCVCVSAFWSSPC